MVTQTHWQKILSSRIQQGLRWLDLRSPGWALAVGLAVGAGLGAVTLGFAEGCWGWRSEHWLERRRDTGGLILKTVSTRYTLRADRQNRKAPPKRGNNAKMKAWL